jgi:uncharacterized protein
VDVALVLVVGLLAGTIGGIVGFGSSIMLLPVLVIAHGPRLAVPIMAIASVLANLARILVWWREVDWRACAVYSATGIPAAALGARTLLALPPRIVEAALGAFFLGMIPLRRWLATRQLRLQRWHLAVAGAVIGFLTGIVVSTGPINAPLFLAYGLIKGAFIATEAAASLAVYVSKAATFRSLGALPFDVIAQGLVTGSSLMLGALLAKRFVIRLDARRFRLLMDALLAVSGITMLWTALR